MFSFCTYVGLRFHLSILHGGCPAFTLQPAMCGKVDPAVLAALPPSMQLDLLVQVDCTCNSLFLIR